MSINTRPVANRGPPSEADRVWYRIVRQVVSMRRRLGSRSEGAQTQSEYIQQCLQREANGEAAILPTPEELKLMLTNINGTARTLVHASLDLFKECRAFEQYAANALASFVGGDIGRLADDDKEGSGGIQFSPSQVEDFVQTLVRVELTTLETDEAHCSICKMEYGTDRGGTDGTEPVDQGLPSEDAPEYPVKLSCCHVFGECCMKTWLLGQLASCPTCRVQFKPVY